MQIFPSEQWLKKKRQKWLHSISLFSVALHLQTRASWQHGCCQSGNFSCLVATKRYCQYGLMLIKTLNTGLYDLTLSSHIIFYHTVSYRTCLCKASSCRHGSMCTSVTVCHMTSARQLPPVCEQVLLQILPSVCLSRPELLHTCPCACVFVCAYAHKCISMCAH